MMIAHDYSRYSGLRFLHSKDEAKQHFTKYLAGIAPRNVEIAGSVVFSGISTLHAHVHVTFRLVRLENTVTLTFHVKF